MGKEKFHLRQPSKNSVFFLLSMTWIINILFVYRIKARH